MSSVRPTRHIIDHVMLTLPPVKKLLSHCESGRILLKTEKSRKSFSPLLTSAIIRFPYDFPTLTQTATGFPACKWVGGMKD